MHVASFPPFVAVWAFGVTAWELLTCGDVPYLSIMDDDRVAAFVRGGGQLERPAACAGASYDSLWRLIRSCWAQRPKDRPTFAELSVALGQVATPTDGGAGGAPAPAAARGIAVTAASVAPDHLFVFRSTGALVTMAWLFENEYKKSDCDSVYVIRQLRLSACACWWLLFWDWAAPYAT